MADKTVALNPVVGMVMTIIIVLVSYSTVPSPYYLRELNDNATRSLEI